MSVRLRTIVERVRRRSVLFAMDDFEAAGRGELILGVAAVVMALALAASTIVIVILT